MYRPNLQSIALAVPEIIVIAVLTIPRFKRGRRKINNLVPATKEVNFVSKTQF